MKDFAQWCFEHNLIDIYEDGTVKWKEKGPIKDGKRIPFKQKISGKVREFEDDLSNDYQGHYDHMGTVWPFKLKAAKGEGKPVAKK